MKLLIKLSSYFNHYEGHQECGISSTDLYIPPVIGKVDKHTHYCPNRATLLEAMSGGGRHGFDAPFHPAGCHYRWYTTPEICMILERFDAIIFIGDDMIKNIYAAFNMLLRENIALGGLKQWDMKESERETCRCDNQITRPECDKYTVTNSEDVRKNDIGSGHPNPYFCNRTKSIFFLYYGSRLTDYDRHTALLSAHSHVPCTRRAAYHFHHNPCQGPGLLQAHTRDSFAWSSHLTVLVCSNRFYG